MTGELTLDEALSADARCALSILDAEGDHRGLGRAEFATGTRTRSPCNFARDGGDAAETASQCTRAPRVLAPARSASGTQAEALFYGATPVEEALADVRATPRVTRRTEMSEAKVMTVLGGAATRWPVNIDEAPTLLDQGRASRSTTISAR